MTLLLAGPMLRASLPATLADYHADGKIKEVSAKIRAA